jgi:filamentous hemagglutinin family protein
MPVVSANKRISACRMDGQTQAADTSRQAPVCFVDIAVKNRFLFVQNRRENHKAVTPRYVSLPSLAIVHLVRAGGFNFMIAIRRLGFKGTALAASIALAIGSGTALAAATPAATQLPGKGSIVSGQVSAGRVIDGQQTITIGSAHAVINWGSGSALNAGAVGGFNIGADAGLRFVNGAGEGHNVAVLNIDRSGNPSQIDGKLSGTGTSIFVANANGIVVGSGARLASTAGIGLIANKTLAGTGRDFHGGSSIVYSGSGGDVTVIKGASIDAPSVLIAGGGNVNVNLGALKGPSGSAMLSAGVASVGSGTANNHNASLTSSGALASGRSLGGFNSAGSALNTGTLALANYRVDGLFTNTGTLALPASNGAVHNRNQLTTSGAASFRSLVNDGTYVARNVSVLGGNLVNNGTLHAISVAVTDGSLINSGHLVGVYNLSTGSDANRVAGADYSITNTGWIVSYGSLTIDANRSRRLGQDNSSGSFTSTGTLRLASGHNLTIQTRSDLTLAGKVQTGSGSTIQDVSQYQPGATLGTITLAASGYDAAAATPTFRTNGSLRVLTPLASTTGMQLQGRQMQLMRDLGVVAFSADGSVDPAGRIAVVAGGSMAAAHAYAVTVGEGATVSARVVNVAGPHYRVAPADGRVVQPNVLLRGLLSASDAIHLGSASAPVSDVFGAGAEDQSGLLLTGPAPSLTIAFTGNVGLAPNLRDGNFRHHYLAVDSREADALSLSLQPIAYASHGGSANLLVDGNVRLTPPAYQSSPAIYGVGSARGAASVPNTHLVLQAAGNITTGDGGFYWPGAVYLGTVDYDYAGQAAPGTLGDGTITLGGNFSNVLPGSTAGDGGIEFITQHPLGMRSYTVTTNANSPISFGTAALTRQYASGSLGKGLFFGGKQGSGEVVNYGALDASMFRTDAPGG